MIKCCEAVEQGDWLELRFRLWPENDRATHLVEMLQLVAEPERFIQFIAYDDLNRPVGLVEASVRTDYVNGTNSSPVVFLEGLYVEPAARRQGVARSMVTAIEQWACDRGYKEFASDSLIENGAAHSLHRALGFEESERVVFFRKALA